MHIFANWNFKICFWSYFSCLWHPEVPVNSNSTKQLYNVNYWDYCSYLCCKWLLSTPPAGGKGRGKVLLLCSYVWSGTLHPVTSDPDITTSDSAITKMILLCIRYKCQYHACENCVSISQLSLVGHGNGCLWTHCNASCVLRLVITCKPSSSVLNEWYRHNYRLPTFQYTPVSSRLCGPSA